MHSIFLVGPFQLRTSHGSKRFSSVARERGGFPPGQLSPFCALLAPPAQRFLLTQPDSHHEFPARSVILTQRLESSVTSGMQSRGGGWPGQSSADSTAPQPHQPFAGIYRGRRPQQWELKGFFNSSSGGTQGSAHHQAEPAGEAEPEQWSSTHPTIASETVHSLQWHENGLISP